MIACEVCNDKNFCNFGYEGWEDYCKEFDKHKGGY